MLKRLSAACALLAALSWSFTALAATEASGQTPGGAFYRIAVPDAWNGTLVIWNHGYEFSEPDAEVDLGPLADLQLTEGYAVAASSYRDGQWAVFKTDRDLEDLVRAFREQFGEPRSVIVTGASLGGIVTASALERANLGNVVGAYPLCGAVAGSRVWDGALDIRLTYDAVCGDVPGAAIPGGATGKPSQFFPITNTQIALAVDACTGILAQTPELRTPEEQARLDKLLANVNIPESFLLTDMVFSVVGLADLTFDHGKLRGKPGVGNVGVTYNDPDVDASIERVEAHPGGARRLQNNFVPRGRVGDVKIVSLHTDKDGLVIVENEKEYDDVVDDDKLTIATVIEAEPSHCDFNPAEVIAGWESLRGWLAGAPQPTAAGIQVTCQVIEGTGLAPGPCRIDPSFSVPDMDERVKPRSNTPPGVR
jgi:acetyl esterase/lipase